MADSEFDPIPLTPPPGVIKTESDRVEEGRWTDTQWMRFVNGRPQKMGGWLKQTTSIASGTLRTLHAWRDLQSIEYMAGGTYRKLYVYERDWTQHDITPLDASGTLTNPFSTTAGSSIVTVAHAAHGRNTGDVVNYSGGSPINSRAWTASGNAQLDTSDKKFGLASALFDGTGDWIRTPDGADFSIGSSNFTVEFWFRRASSGALFIAGQSDAAGTPANQSIIIQIASGNVIKATATQVGPVYATITGTTVFTDVTNPGWHHVAFVRTGNTLKLFIDGVQEGGNVSMTSAMNDSANQWGIGSLGEVSTSPWNGWIDEFRLSVGIARYTANFTPPTAAFSADAFTKVLLHFDGSDASTTFTDSAGLTLDGSYEVLAAASSSYTIDAGSNSPVTSVASGGTVNYEYEIPIGVELGIYGLGYGAGPYGTGTYGTARPFSTIFIEPRIWSMDHFGRILLAAYNGGSLYKFDPSDVPAFGRATVVADAPTDIRYMFITEERFVFALCEDMRVDWASQNDYTLWTPADDNTANTRTLAEGTKLIAGAALGNHVSCVWSDFALYIFQYTGTTAIFSSRLAGRNCGLVSPSAKVTVNNFAYWMGHTNFYQYNGAVGFIPNSEDIRAYVFDRLNAEQAYLCWAQYVAKYNEVIWFYIALGETQPSYYALLCLNDYSWATGQMLRTAGTAFSHGDTRPYLAGDDGHIYLHEEGVNGDGAAVLASIRLAPSSLMKGAQIFNIDGMVADFEDQSGDITVTFEGWDRLRKPTVDCETKTITEDDDLIDLRLEGRYISLELTTDVVDGYFRFGKPDVLISSNGTRR